MAFDIDTVLSDMQAALREAAGGGGRDMRAFAERAVAEHREALAALAEARIAGHIDGAAFDHEIERERRVLESELLALEIMGRAAAQRAVNEALAVFARAVATAVRG